MLARRRAKKGCAVIMGTALLTALGCSEEPVGPTTEDFAKEREASKARIALAQKNKARARPRAPAPVAKPVDPIALMASVDRGFSYDPTGKRDPFRSFMWDRPDRMLQRSDTGPLEQFDLNQLEVVAVIWRTGNARALVQDPAGESYIIAEGASIGKNQGEVLSIADNLVLVKEIYVDYLGQETTKDIEMRMRRNEGG